jgi:hypothetical protein
MTAPTFFKFVSCFPHSNGLAESVCCSTSFSNVEKENDYEKEAGVNIS